MIGDVLLIEQKHERVARELAAKIRRRKFDRLVISIGGESGSGKSEVAETLRAVLKSEGFQVKILHLDNYYKISPVIRNEHRKKHGMDAVGLHEINWDVLEENISAFRAGKPTTLPFLDLYTNQEDKLITEFSNIDIVIVEGLYACGASADIRVLIDLTYHDTKKAQVKRKKEKVDKLRFMVLEKEHTEVNKLRKDTDYFISPDFKLVSNRKKHKNLTEKESGRIIFVSDHLPVRLIRKKDKIKAEDIEDGIGEALGSVYRAYDSIWFGRCHAIPFDISPAEKREITSRLQKELNCCPVFPKDRELEQNYMKFRKYVLWPLFHYRTESCNFDPGNWDAYEKFNREMFEKVSRAVKEKDTVWVNGFELMLLPSMLREAFPEISIGFHFHAPFPSYELFRMIPWREEILNGLLGADLIGFHNYDYVRHFQSSVFRILGYESKMGTINIGERLIKTDAFSLGVDFARYADLHKKKTIQNKINKLNENIGSRKTVLAVERIDQCGGLIKCLKAFEGMLKSHPEMPARVKFYIRTTDGLSSVHEVSALKREMEAVIKNCNRNFLGKSGSLADYVHGPLNENETVALCCVSDILLVASERDGLNLLSKRYLACRSGKQSTLVLSEFAGGTRDLSDAIVFNPNDFNDCREALSSALVGRSGSMIDDESDMAKSLKRNTAMRWAVEFTEGLKAVKQKQEEARTKLLSGKLRTQLLTDYHTSNRRIIILDYNGTLVPLPKKGISEPPGSSIKNLLTLLGESRQNRVVIISDNEMALLDKWFRDISVDLIACSDAAYRTDEWNTLEELPNNWKEDARPILERFVDRTPGSHIQEKKYSMIWHFEKATKELGDVRSRELMDNLKSFTATDYLSVNEGERLIEIKNAETFKGNILRTYLGDSIGDFILAIGDDWSNEYMFEYLPESANTIRVGNAATNAKFRIDQQNKVPELLKAIVNAAD